MRYVRHIEDEWGNLIDVLYYCCELCWRDECDPVTRVAQGGWWPALDTELDVPEGCRVCGETIGPSDSGDLGSEPLARPTLAS